MNTYNKKKKRDNTWLCYTGLVILSILLLLPPALWIFGKNLYVKEEVQKDEVIILTCNKRNESISSTFYNGEPQNLDYIVKGDYSVKVDEESSTTTEENQLKNDDLMSIIKPYAQIEYDKNENNTKFKVKVIDLKDLKDYTPIFSTSEKQYAYYNSLAFYCTKSVY